MYERITLSGSRFLLANKYTRAGLFVYTLALHSLVSAQTSRTVPGRSERFCG